MRTARIFGWAAGADFAAAAVGVGLLLSGCGMPGAPQPPSLNLPDAVTDLAAMRAGNQVRLTWTMPRKNTDKLLLKGDAQVRVCRRDSGGAACVAAGNAQFAPGADGEFAETLRAAPAGGRPRALTYFVEVVNRKGRSAGLSNGASVPAGEAPAPVDGLSAEMAKNGVLLRWTAGGAEAVRLERKLLTPPSPGTKKEQGPLAPPPEPLERSLLVEAGAQGGRAVDKDIRFGESYEYRAQRVATVAVGDQKLELSGPFSAPVRIDAKNIFPPETPLDLSAVATAGENGPAAAIDLSWQPDTEADLAGYIVYRREAGGSWQRISPAEPVVGPGFHDANVQAGHKYFYAVTAIDQGGLESGRSAEAQETVPNP